MRIGYQRVVADEGKGFVLTEKGYNNTPDKVKIEREIGKPLKGHEDNVPLSWVKNGFVEEVVLYTCSKCGDVLRDDDLAEFKEMGERYHKKPFMCPDCYDRFCRKDLEDQFEEAMSL